MEITKEISYISIFISICLVVIGQIFIKKGSISVTLYNKNIFKTVRNIISEKNLIIGLITTLIAPLFYFIALKNLDLSIAFGFNSLNYLFVSLAGWYFWKEEIKFQKILGLLFIVVGIIFIAL